MTFPNVRGLLYHNLPGKLTDKEIYEVEKRVADDYREQLRGAEPVLFAAYVSGDLTVDMRKSCEEYFSRSEENLKKLRIAELLHEHTKTDAPKVPDVNGQLHRYLLGELSDSERSRVEERMAADSDAKRDLETADIELIAAYTTKILTEDEHERLGRYFYSSEDNTEKLRFAEAVWENYEQVQWAEAQDRASARLLNQLRSRLANYVRVLVARLEGRGTDF